MVILRVDFLNDTFHAADPSDPQYPEWPPAPDRLYQALVAGAYGGRLDPFPLRTLEEHSPEIAYADAQAVHGATVYVPAAYKAKQGRVSKYDPVMVGITEPVYYLWPDVSEEHLQKIGAIASNVDYLGRAKTPVSITAVSTLPETAHRLAPSVSGDQLIRVPHAGRLDELDAAFAVGRRANVAGMVAYTDLTETTPESPWGELLVLRPQRDLSISRASHVSEALRNAALSVAGDNAPTVLHGHDGEHAAWTVIPDVGHQYARGHVLGMGFWLPRDVEDAIRTQCVMALMGVKYVKVDQFHVPVGLPPVHQQLPYGLRQRTWAKPSKSWATVTPLVFDRHPKRGQVAEQVIADSVEMAGYPRPVEVAIRQEGAFRGVPVARAFKPRRGGRWTHVTILFDQPVRGPVLIGRDRHFGMGLFRPLPVYTQTATASEPVSVNAAS